MSRALLTLLLLAGLAPVSLSAQAGTGGEPVLRPGDRVAIEVYRNREMSGTFTVAPDSTLLHPVFRGVRVAGVPQGVAEARVREALRRFDADPMFSFGPEYRVFVGGHVREQNQFFLPEVSVAQAISRAGGSTAPDRRYRLRFVRDGRQTVVNLADPAATEILQQPIRSGDQVVIEERPSFSRTYLDPAIRVVQTVGTVLSAYVILTQILRDDDPASSNK
ncbi:MAG TPA: polysaccharide biosynthesis/export family protein [Longimicrobiaceae bacterium]|nr:polysaccharide biosynthesis/export family protein [Longimicrobiaceae bacterium]